MYNITAGSQEFVRPRQTAGDSCPKRNRIIQSAAAGVRRTPAPADNNGMDRSTASIVSGTVVGVLTGVAAWSFLMAATWSSIHGGMSGMTLAVLSLVAMAVPPGCGFLLGRAVYHRWPRRGQTQMTDTIRLPRGTAIQTIDATGLNCPECGCSVKPAQYPATPRYTVVECPIHGPLHFGPDTDLTLGRPPR